MRDHNKHKILGNYCWTCQRPTVAGIPGWAKASKDDGPKEIEFMPTSVVWADGSEDSARECVMCHTTTCKYPVHDEEYSEIEVANGL